MALGLGAEGFVVRAVPGVQLVGYSAVKPPRIVGTTVAVTARASRGSYLLPMELVGPLLHTLQDGIDAAQTHPSSPVATAIAPSQRPERSDNPW